LNTAVCPAAGINQLFGGGMSPSNSGDLSWSPAGDSDSSPGGSSGSTTKKGLQHPNGLAAKESNSSSISPSQAVDSVDTGKVGGTKILKKLVRRQIPGNGYDLLAR
jgi:hypothetical protein